MFDRNREDGNPLRVGKALHKRYTLTQAVQQIANLLVIVGALTLK